jgi:predicted HicB family RNase H-like nuclease
VTTQEFVVSLPILTQSAKLTTMMKIKEMLFAQLEASKVSPLPEPRTEHFERLDGPSLMCRTRAANDTVPISLKVRVTRDQAQSLEAKASAQGVSVATVVRGAIEMLLAGSK